MTKIIIIIIIIRRTLQSLELGTASNSKIRAISKSEGDLNKKALQRVIVVSRPRVLLRPDEEGFVFIFSKGYGLKKFFFK